MLFLYTVWPHSFTWTSPITSLTPAQSEYHCSLILLNNLMAGPLRCYYIQSIYTHTQTNGAAAYISYFSVTSNVTKNLLHLSNKVFLNFRCVIPLIYFQFVSILYDKSRWIGSVTKVDWTSNMSNNYIWNHCKAFAFRL